jgi:hypothetical protein
MSEPPTICPETSGGYVREAGGFWQSAAFEQPAVASAFGQPAAAPNAFGQPAAEPAATGFGTDSDFKAPPTGKNLMHRIQGRNDRCHVFLSSGGRACATCGQVFFRANAQIKNSKLRKGIRALVYEIATSCGASYDGDKSTSIFYNNNDLQIRILFSTRGKCAKFLNKLDDQLTYFQLAEPMDFDRIPEEVYLLTHPERIFRRDYISVDTDADNYSIDITRLTHLSRRGHIDRITEFQMVESPKLDDFVALSIYKCHLRSRSAFPEDRDNINNWLWMSWTFHRRFDGLNNIHIHQPQVPQIAIRFVKIVEGVVETEGDTEWYRVEVAIECLEAVLWDLMQRRIKDGMRVDPERREIVTWVFVQDPAEFNRCLTYKYEETHYIWQKKEPGEVVTEEEASDLRRSARNVLQARK